MNKKYEYLEELAMDITDCYKVGMSSDITTLSLDTIIGFLVGKYGIETLSKKINELEGN